MSKINWDEIEKEIVNYARSLVKDNRQATSSQTFTATEGQTTYTITETPICINSVTINSVSKKWGLDYSYNFTTKVLTLVTGASAGQSVVISYDKTYSWGYWKYPQINLTIDTYPIFGCKWLGGDVQLLDRVSSVNNKVFRLWVYDDNSDTVKSKLNTISNAFFSKLDWYLDGKGCQRIVPITNIEDPNIDDRRGKSGKVYGAYIDFEVVGVIETI